MKPSDIYYIVYTDIPLIKDTYLEGFKELVDLDTPGQIRLTLKDGSILLVETTEWCRIYLKEPEP